MAAQEPSDGGGSKHLEWASLDDEESIAKSAKGEINIVSPNVSADGLFA